MLDYKFILNIGTSLQDIRVWPIYKDDLAIECKLESGQQFYRRKLSGDLVFIGEDFHTIHNEAFGTEFKITIYSTADRGATWDIYWRGKFTHTDCTFNTDDEKVTVKPEVLDRYTALLAGWDKEFDLIKLTPAMQRILVRKRPMVQIYTEDDDTISCFMGTISFEMDVSIPSDVDYVRDYLLDTCHFSLISDYVELNFTSYPAGQETAFAAPFTGVVTNGAYLTSTAGIYRIQYYEETETVQIGDITGLKYINGLRVMSVNDTTVLWEFEQERAFDGFLPLPEEIEFASQQEGVDDLVAYKASNTVYGRIVCNTEYIGKQRTYKLYNDDLVQYNRNYLYAIGYGGTGELAQSARTSNTPTEWGQTDAGTYFLPPTDDSRWIPVGQSKWVNTSVWFMPLTYTQGVERDARQAYLLRDTYPLASCLAVLLQACESGVVFAGTTDYSQFLYEIQANGQQREMYLTPKSNITAGEYQTPAQTAPVTLREVLNMLRDTYRCYWFIDSSARLRIEHVQWFMRGGSYSGSMVVGTDLTNLETIRSRLKWSFGQNEYSYDKLDMPERYEFEWMDDVTAPFKGNPIDVVSPFVEQGKIENVSVGQFTSDIDFMLLNPSGISQDGFALMTVEEPNALNSGGTTIYAMDEESDILGVASYIGGNSIAMRIALSGSGVATIVWYANGQRIVSAISLDVPLSAGTLYISAPEGVTGIAFSVSGNATISISWIRMANDIAKQLPFLTETFNGQSIIMQNGWLSFLKLQNPYWRYDMPAKSVLMNGETTSVYMVSRKKKQTVNFPSGDSDPDEQKLIKTGVGSGKVDSMTVKLTSRMAKVNLIFDTY